MPTRVDVPDTLRLIRLYDTARGEFWGPGEEVAEEPKPGPAPYWRASMLGYCLRAQCLKRAGVPPGREVDEASRARMEAGKEHEWLYRIKWDHMGFLVQAQVRISDPVLNLDGHLDLVIGGELQDLPDRAFFWAPGWRDFIRALRRRAYELTGGALPVVGQEVKSVGTYAWSSIPPSGRSYNMIQAGAYGLLGGLHPDVFRIPPERFEVVLVNRDTRAYRVLDVPAAWRYEAEGRLAKLNEVWASGKWPDCTCGLTEDMTWESKLCDWPNPDGDGCCGQTLLDRLEASLEGAT